MLDIAFTSMFAVNGITVGSFLTCIGVALALGLVFPVVYSIRTVCTQSFMATVALLPAIVSVIIMMVGGNLGAGVAVAGTFSLVRFRSVPGTAREICAIFMAMAAGLACGMGYPGLAALFTAIVCLVSLILTVLNFGGKRNGALRKVLRITVPEDLDYSEVFTDILNEYTTEATMTSVKTTNLGSLNRLTYDIVLRKAGTEKAMIDELRCRNGNLEISLSVQEMDSRDL